MLSILADFPQLADRGYHLILFANSKLVNLSSYPRKILASRPIGNCSRRSTARGATHGAIWSGSRKEEGFGFSDSRGRRYSSNANRPVFNLNGLTEVQKDALAFFDLYERDPVRTLSRIAPKKITRTSLLERRFIEKNEQLGYKKRFRRTSKAGSMRARVKWAR